MPESISVGNDAFANYIKVASLPRNERQKSFRELSNEQKASFVKVQLAMQFVKRSNLTKQQRDFFSETLSKVSPDIYDKGNPQKAALANQIGQETEAKVFGLFAQKDAFEILEGLGASKTEDVALLQKYEDLLKAGMQFRKKLVKEMPMAERVAIWKTQMAYHLATSSFNRQQKEFIVEFMPTIQSVFEASANLSGEDRTKYVEALESSMFKVFTKAEAYAVFMVIGIQKSSDRTNLESTGQNPLRPHNIRRNLSETLVSNLLPNNKSTRFLTAKGQTFPCDCRWYCDTTNTNCERRECYPTWTGCGPLDDWGCTNLCVHGPQS